MSAASLIMTAAMGAPLLSTLGKISAATTKEATLAASDKGSAMTKAAMYVNPNP